MRNYRSPYPLPKNNDEASPTPSCSARVRRNLSNEAGKQIWAMVELAASKAPEFMRPIVEMVAREEIKSKALNAKGEPESPNGKR